MKGKKSNLIYYFENLLRYIYPRFLCRFRTNFILSAARKRPDFDYMMDRMNYYNKIDHVFSLENDGMKIKDFTLFPKKGSSAHFFDTYEYIRFFPKDHKFAFVFGDVTHIPSVPSIVKSRPIAGDNQNSVMMKLGKRRHFIFLKDKIPFCKKDNKIIFYAGIHGKPHRIDFMNKYFDHPECICGSISNEESIPKQWLVKKISLKKHLTHKFILALEGNDVSTNLKWIMSSNSLAVMPKPKYETWFMEGRLIPDFHYVEIKDDYSDLIERMNYFIENPSEAEKIIKNANDYVSQFKNQKREKIISLLVLQKYFHASQ